MFADVLSCMVTIVLLMVKQSGAFSPVGTSGHQTQVGQFGRCLPLPMKSHAAAGFPSMVDRESAVSVEWEPLAEMEYQLNDERRYEHFDSRSGQSAKANLDPQAVQGVFCGFRWTSEEYNRLKSGHP